MAGHTGQILRRDSLMLSKVQSAREIRICPHATFQHSLAGPYETSGCSYCSVATRSTRTTTDTQRFLCREIQLPHEPLTMAGKPGLSPNSMTLFLHRGLGQRAQ
jgi:hypothetical protein